MIRFISIVLLIFFTTFSSFTKAMQTETSAVPCQIKEFRNPDGWTIPGLSKAIVKTSHLRYAPDHIENVYVDILVPMNPASYIKFFSLFSGVIEVKNVPVDVTQIERFSMNGHVFGYHVIAIDAGYGKDGKRVRFGFQEREYYYDPDGSGKFTAMRHAGELFFRIIIPDWVKQATAAK